MLSLAHGQFHLATPPKVPGPPLTDGNRGALPRGREGPQGHWPATFYLRQ